jgi:NADPH:quinone reductase-like Zn-dependent oxidoreductase
VRAQGIEQFSGPVVALELPDPPQPAPGELVIAVKASAVANWDDFARRGDWQIGPTPPMALGVEGAGLVTAVGVGADPDLIGKAVLTHPLPLPGQGLWAESALIPAASAALIPDGLSMPAAAALPVPGLTAHQALAALGLERDETVLVTGAAGVTGGIVVQLARHYGARVIAAARAKRHEQVRAFGASEVVDSDADDWFARVRELAGGQGVDAAVNAQPSAAALAIDAVRDGGGLATLTGDPPAASRGIAIHNVYVQADGEALGELAKLAAAGSIQIPIAATYPLDEAAAALAHAVRGAGGAVVLDLAA